MTLPSIRFLYVLLVLTYLSGSIDILANREKPEPSYPNPYGKSLGGVNRWSGRSLLSRKTKHDTALVAALDGTIYLVDSHSREVFWSFNSGPSIHSSYQIPINEDSDNGNTSGLSSGYFVDCGDDWELYAHTRHFGKMKLTMTVDQFVTTTPLIAEDGGVTLGSKKTTVFVVNVKTGRLIHTYDLADSLTTTGSNIEKNILPKKIVEDWVEPDSMGVNNTELPLYITRTDYLLQSFAPNSNKVLWNMTVAEIGAAFLCQDATNPFGEAPVPSAYESEYGSDFDLPLPCQSKAVVYRFWNHNMLKSFSGTGRVLEAHHGEKMLANLALPTTISKNMLPSEHIFDNGLGLRDASTEVALQQPLLEMKNSGIPGALDLKTYNAGSPNMSERSVVFYIYLSLILVIAFVIRHYALSAKLQVELNKDPINFSAKISPAKRKKARKSGKNSGSNEKKDKNLSAENEDGVAQPHDFPLLDLNKLVDAGVDRRRIGKLLVFSKEIAKGSNGTVVLEGIYEGRPVAVKRLVQVHHDAAFKEIQNLIASDRHPNIVRWYGVEHDKDFVYLSLERCCCNLDDLIQIYSVSSQGSIPAKEHATSAMEEDKVRLHSIKNIMQDINLWKEKGFPSSILLQLMRDVVSGLVHLHDLGIIHRDLKPQNVLIVKEKALCAKLSDMGISRRLVGDMSSLGHHVTGCGSSGWQAPEQLLHERQTRAVDLFSLGCVLFFCITGGRHPFGDRLERDINIVKNQVDLFLVDHIPEAVDLFSRLLNPNPQPRPKALEVLHHPLFWSSEMRLSFLRDTSDWIELEDRESDSDILKAIESTAPVSLGGKWVEKMEPAFINNIGRYRRYKFDCVRDLLRVMRNKLNHYRELPKEIQELLGPVPNGFDGYFASRFPKLLIEVYKVIYIYCMAEECFHKYFKGTVA